MNLSEANFRKRIDDRLKELAKKACRSIGCSGVDPDMCQNRPQDCSIIRKIMGCKEERDGAI
jgi:hypothetical protein